VGLLDVMIDESTVTTQPSLTAVLASRSHQLDRYAGARAAGATRAQPHHPRLPEEKPC
jgi:hypothetical protein